MRNGRPMSESGKGKKTGSKIPGNNPGKDKKSMNGYSEAYRKNMPKSPRVSEDAGSGEGY